MKRKIMKNFLACIFVFALVIGLLSVYGQGNIISFDTNENNLGYIYFDYNPVIYVTLKNPEVDGKRTTIFAEVEDESGNIVWSNCYEVELLGNESTSLGISPQISRFGIYSLNLCADGITAKQKFSVSNRPRDGAVSSWCMINDHSIKGHGIKELSRKMELLYKAGFGGIRQEYLWEGFEPAVDSFLVPTEVADTIELMEMYDMDIMGIMMGCPRYISEWNNGTLPVSEASLKEWTKYAQYTASKTKEISTYYEVWNEYNMRDGANPDNYIKLLKASYEALHQANPNAVVCGFAAANIGEQQTEYEYSAIEWIDAVLKRGGGEYMDAVSIHCYVNRAPEDNLSTVKTGKTWLIDETRALLDRYGYTDMPIIVSEMGWSTGDTGYSDAEKAWFMIRYSAMNYGKIDRLYWYVSQDKQNYDENGNPDLYENELGLIETWDTTVSCETPYGAKPAFLAVANFNAMMNGAVSVGESTTDRDVYQYGFKDKHNNTIYIAWSIKKDGAQIKVSGDGKCVTVYDVYGNVISSNPNCDMTEVRLGGAPVYIKITDEEESVAEYYPEITIDYNSGKVHISGTSAYGAMSAAIAVVKKDVDEVERADIGYVGQTKMKTNGGYEFEFMLEKPEGIYTANIGFMGNDKTQVMDINFDVFFPALSVLSEGVLVKELSQIKDEDELCVKLEEIQNRTADGEIMLIAALYKDGRIEDVVAKDIESGSSMAELKFLVEDTTKVDKIKIFFWSKINMKPLMGVYEIN